MLAHHREADHAADFGHRYFDCGAGAFVRRAGAERALSEPAGPPDRAGRTRRQSGRAGAACCRQKFTDTLGRPFVVENMPGAGGVVAANVVAKAPPDGHVLMLADSGALAINPALQTGLSLRPAEGLHADHRNRHAADRVRGAAQPSGEDAGRVHRARQEGPRQADLRLCRARLDPSHHHGGVRRPRRPRHAARALPRRHRDGERAAGR